MAEKPINGGGPAADASAAMEVEDDATLTTTPSATTAVVQPDMVIVHPLVLLSVVDHYNREAKVGNGSAAGTWRTEALTHFGPAVGTLARVIGYKPTRSRRPAWPVGRQEPGYYEQLRWWES